MCVSWQAFKKYEILTRKREAEVMRQEETKKVERMATPSSSDGASGGVATESRRGREDDGELPIFIPNQEDSPPAEEVKKQQKESGGGGGGGGGEREITARKTVSEKSKGDGNTDKKERIKAFNYTSDVYNGADMESYKWSQTVTELEIKVPLSEQTAGKHVKVDIQSERLRVEILHPEQKVLKSIADL